MKRQRMFPPHKIAFNTEDHKCNLTAAVEQSLADFDKKKRVPVREQEPDVRNKNFEEVCFGYNDQEASSFAS